MKVINVVKYIFTLVGVGLLIGAFFVYKDAADFLKQAESAPGTVVRLLESRSSSSSSNSTMYTPVVQFTDKRGSEIEFTSSISSSPPSYDVGEEVEVLYTPSTPQDARIKGFFSLWGVATILGALGGVFAGIGLGIFVYGKLKANKIASLKRRGRVIETTFQGVDQNTSLEVNGKNPFIIVSHWQNPSTSKLHIFRSDNIWFDPTDFVKSNVIKVLADENNLKKYHVDLSFLPEIA